VSVETRHCDAVPQRYKLNRIAANSLLALTELRTQHEEYFIDGMSWHMTGTFIERSSISIGVLGLYLGKECLQALLAVEKRSETRV